MLRQLCIGHSQRVGRRGKQDDLLDECRDDVVIKERPLTSSTSRGRDSSSNGKSASVFINAEHRRTMRGPCCRQGHLALTMEARCAKCEGAEASSQNMRS
jgi:hypothetical protein